MIEGITHGGLAALPLALLAWSLPRPRRLSSLAVAAFGGGLLLLPLMGAEFIPTLDEGAIGIEAIREPSTSVPEAIREAQSLEATLVAAFPDEVETVVTRTGAAEISTDPGELEMSDVIVMLKPREQWTRAEDRESLTAAMREAAERSAPGMNLYFSQPIEQRSNEMIEGVRADAAIVVHGADLEVLADLGARIGRAVAEVPGADTVKVERVAGQPVLTARVDQEAISRLGMDATDVLDAIEAVRGRDVGEVVIGRRRYAIQVRFPAAIRDDMERLALATSAEAEVQGPLATAVTGGLVTNTLLTLVMLPVLYARWVPSGGE